MNLVQDVDALNRFNTVTANTIYTVFAFVKTTLHYGRDKVLLLPRNQKILVILVENIKLARLLRKLSCAIVAERANISRPTLLAIKSGSTDVSIGVVPQVLFVPGLEKEMIKVASDDQLDRKLQDLGLTVKKRALKVKDPTPVADVDTARLL